MGKYFACAIIGILMVIAVIAFVFSMIAESAKDRTEGLQCGSWIETFYKWLSPENVDQGIDVLCGGGSSGGAGASGGWECTGSGGGINVPSEYMEFVNGAAEAYGLEVPALIAIIQQESSWNPNISNSESTAMGLGQFLDETAFGKLQDNGTRVGGMKEFVGGEDRKGRKWTPGTMGGINDARKDPERSIYAVADYDTTMSTLATEKCSGLGGAEYIGCLYLYNHHRGCAKFDESSADINKECPRTSNPTEECKCIEGVKGKKAVISNYNQLTGAGGSCTQIRLAGGPCSDRILFAARIYAAPPQILYGQAEEGGFEGHCGSDSLGRTSSVGVLDCSGLVSRVYRDVDIFTGNKDSWCKDTSLLVKMAQDPNNPYLTNITKDELMPGDIIVSGVDENGNKIYVNGKSQGHAVIFIEKIDTTHQKVIQSTSTIVPDGAGDGVREENRSDRPNQTYIRSKIDCSTEEDPVFRDPTKPPKPGVTEKFLDFTTPFGAPVKKTRLQWIQEYSKNHYEEDTYFLTPKAVVWHYTVGNDTTGEGLFNMENGTDKATNDEEYPKPYVHYFIDKNGKIFQFTPDNYRARGAPCINDKAIHIELAGDKEDDILTRKVQYDQALALTRYLMGKYNISPLSVVGHGELYFDQNLNTKINPLCNKKDANITSRHHDWYIKMAQVRSIL